MISFVMEKVELTEQVQRVRIRCCECALRCLGQVHDQPIYLNDVNRCNHLSTTKPQHSLIDFTTEMSKPGFKRVGVAVQPRLT